MKTTYSVLIHMINLTSYKSKLGLME